MSYIHLYCDFLNYNTFIIVKFYWSNILKYCNIVLSQYYIYWDLLISYILLYCNIFNYKVLFIVTFIVIISEILKMFRNNWYNINIIVTFLSNYYNIVTSNTYIIFLYCNFFCCFIFIFPNNIYYTLTFYIAIFFNIVRYNIPIFWLL